MIVDREKETAKSPCAHWVKKPPIIREIVNMKAKEKQKIV